MAIRRAFLSRPDRSSADAEVFGFETASSLRGKKISG
jgi:hypothetical protein